MVKIILQWCNIVIFCLCYLESTFLIHITARSYFKEKQFEQPMLSVFWLRQSDFFPFVFFSPVLSSTIEYINHIIKWADSRWFMYLPLTPIAGRENPMNHSFVPPWHVKPWPMLQNNTRGQAWFIPIFLHAGKKFHYPVSSCYKPSPSPDTPINVITLLGPFSV